MTEQWQQRSQVAIPLQAVEVKLFQVAPSRRPDRRGEKSLLDVERGIEIDWLGSHGPMGGEIFIMRWNGMIFSADTRIRSVGKKEDDTRLVDVYRFSGRMDQADEATPLIPVPKATEDAALLLFSEAMLVFGGFFSGLSKPDGKYVVDVNGARRTLRSFGYADAS